MTDISKEPKARLIKGHVANTAYGWAEGLKGNGIVAASAIMRLIDAYEKQEDELQRLREQVRSDQAKIDALMLEYCPKEMTPEQSLRWLDAQAAAQDDGQKP